MRATRLGETYITSDGGEAGGRCFGPHRGENPGRDGLIL